MKKKDTPKQAALRDLMLLPGVGPSISQDLYDLGMRRASDMAKADPEKLYLKHMQLRGCHIDRCVLYVFRCAHYAAKTKEPDPELLKWWAWKD